MYDPDKSFAQLEHETARADGFEIIEMVMSVEETFGITVPDDDAEHIRTPRPARAQLGELVEYLMTALRATDGVSARLQEIALERLLRGITKVIGGPVPPVTSETPWARLLTEEQIWRVRLEVEAELGVPSKKAPRASPQPEKPISAATRRRNALAVGLVGPCVFYSTCWFGGASIDTMVLFAPVVGLACVGLAWGTWWDASKSDSPVFTTVGATARSLVADHASLLKPAGDRWTRGDIEFVVHALTCKYFDCD